MPESKEEVIDPNIHNTEQELKNRLEAKRHLLWVGLYERQKQTMRHGRLDEDWQAQVDRETSLDGQRMEPPRAGSESWRQTNQSRPLRNANLEQIDARGRG